MMKVKDEKTDKSWSLFRSWKFYFFAGILGIALISTGVVFLCIIKSESTPMDSKKSVDQGSDLIDDFGDRNGSPLPTPPSGPKAVSTTAPTPVPVSTQVPANSSPIPSEEPSILTQIPSKEPSMTSVPTKKVYKSISFRVMGDIPYTLKGGSRLISQMKEISSDIQNGKDDSLFIVHLGDTMDYFVSQCQESYFKKVHDIFHEHSILPVLVTPGDNDSVDCPDQSLAAEYFERYYISPLNKWTNQSHIPSIIERPNDRIENFAFTQEDVLFLNFNMVEEPNTVPGFVERIAQNLQWFHHNLEKYKEDLRAIIIFGHSTVGQRIFDPIMEAVEPLGIPLVYFHGNGHKFLESRLMGTKPMWKYFWRVQVDEGWLAPPLRITIKGSEPNSTLSGPMLYHNMIKVDRMGGLY